jgi:rubredoxin
MGLELERECPECGGTNFWLTASTLVHLGEKTKWDCTNCEYGFVKIDETVDTAGA